VGGQSDDRYCVLRRRQSANALGRLDAVENRHLHIHQDDVVVADAHGLDGQLTIVRDVDLVVGLAQHHRDQLLVDLVVLGEQNPQRPHDDLREQRGGGSRFGACRAHKTEQLRKGIEQRLLANRLGQHRVDHSGRVLREAMAPGR
jgi:hypothetical protein